MEQCPLHSGHEEKIRGNSARIIEQRDVCHTYQDKVWRKLEELTEITRANGGPKWLAPLMTALGTAAGISAIYLLKGVFK